MLQKEQVLVWILKKLVEMVGGIIGVGIRPEQDSTIWVEFSLAMSFDCRNSEVNLIGEQMVSR